MTKAIAINPAQRKSKSKTNPRKGGTVAKSKSKSKAKGKSRAKSNPPARRSPRKNQAFKITPTDARNLGMTAAGGAVGGAVTGYLDDMKPEALEAVPTELLTAGAGLLIVAMSKAPAAKAIAAGMIGYAAGSMVEKYVAAAAVDTVVTTTGETTPELGSLYGLQSPQAISNNPIHRRANVGALISVI